MLCNADFIVQPIGVEDIRHFILPARPIKGRKIFRIVLRISDRSEATKTFDSEGQSQSFLYLNVCATRTSIENEGHMSDRLHYTKATLTVALSNPSHHDFLPRVKINFRAVLNIKA